MDPFTDLLFNTLLAFTILFFIAVMFMNPAAKTGNVELKAEYLITVNWPDNDPNDIDTWVEDPNGSVVWFNNREAGLVHLDRDDRGLINDTLDINGRRIQNPLNQEVVTIRGVVPGEYIVNLHYYASDTHQPVEISVKLAKVNPTLEVLYYATEVLQHKGEERTALRFNLAPDGTVTQINRLFKRLVLLG